MARICVFCASSDRIHLAHLELAPADALPARPGDLGTLQELLEAEP